MPSHHKCRACRERPAVVQIRHTYLCQDCTQDIAAQTKAAGPVEGQSIISKADVRLRVPADVVEQGKRFAHYMRLATGDNVDWSDVLRACLRRYMIDRIYDCDYEGRSGNGNGKPPDAAAKPDTALAGSGQL